MPPITPFLPQSEAPAPAPAPVPPAQTSYVPPPEDTPRPTAVSYDALPRVPDPKPAGPAARPRTLPTRLRPRPSPTPRDDPAHRRRPSPTSSGHRCTTDPAPPPAPPAPPATGPPSTGACPGRPHHVFHQCAPSPPSHRRLPPPSPFSTNAPPAAPYGPACRRPTWDTAVPSRPPAAPAPLHRPRLSSSRR